MHCLTELDNHRNRNARLFIELGRILLERIFAGKGGSLASDADTLFIVCAATIGHTEGRPMTTTNISDYLSMPRATVQRKLDMLVRRGFLTHEGKKYLLSDRVVSDTTQTARFDKVIARVCE